MSYPFQQQSGLWIPPDHIRPEEKQIASTESSPFLLTLSGYDAANTSASRGYLYWPSVHPRQELSTLAASVIRERVNWLMANFGFARRMVRGMARMIGTVTPQPNTKSDAFNDAVLGRFMAHAGNEESFDEAGKVCFWSGQIHMNRARFKTGDLLSVPIRNGSRLRMGFYEGTQIGGGDPKEGFIDGVQTEGPFARHVGYRVIHGDDPSKSSVIARRDCRYISNLENMGMTRGLSALAHAVTNMIDVIQTRGFTKKRLKESSTIGTVVERDASMILAPSGGGMGAPIIRQTVEAGDGKKLEVNWQQVFGGGAIPELQPGQKVRVISDDRPTPNNMEFEKAVLKDCLWGVDLPFEALCEFSGITGPGIRLVLSEIKRWVAQEYLSMAKWARWYYGLFVASEIKAGRLPKPYDDPKRPFWWRDVEFIGLADQTIDEGRMGNLAAVELETGCTTWMDIWGGKGAWWWNKVRQRITEYARAKAECAEQGVTYEEVFRRPGTFAVAAPGDKPKKPKGTYLEDGNPST
ncbi:MAG: phage portal protein [Verrucomicrobiales bacterium]